MTPPKGGAAGKFRFTRIGDLSSSLTANFSVSGTATSGTDFTSIGTTVTFAANSATADKTVTALADNAVEGSETVVATVTSGTGYSVGSPSAATVTITDDPPVIEVSATDTTEGGAAGGFTFTRTGGDVTSSLTVYYAVDGTATEGDDYSSLSGTVTFAANSSTANVTLTPVNDSDVEFDETVAAYILPDDGYTIGDDDSASATIHDNETPIVTVSQNSDAVEGGDAGTFWFMRQGDISGSLTVNFSVGGTATSGTDYTSIGTSVTFAAGEDFAIVEVDASDESSSDPNETVTVTIQSGTGYTIGDDDFASLKIIDAATPFVTVETIDDGVEGGTNGKFRFTRTGSTSSSLTVYYTVGGDATSGDDYTALSGSVTIASGYASADVTVTITNDSDDEPAEYVSVEITPDSSYEIGDEGSATLSIEDNDLPAITVEKVVDATETGGRGIFRLLRPLGDLSSTLTVAYSVGGTATAGTDYSSLSGTVTFAANALTADVVVNPNTDSSTEGTETVTLTIVSGTGYGIGSTYSASLDIKEETAGGVSGKMWNDADASETINGVEAGLASVLVFLMKGDEVIDQTLTDANGDYSFSGVLAGVYAVLFDVPGGYTCTTSMDGTEPVTVTPATTSTGIDCGAQPPATTTPTGKRDGIDWNTFDPSTRQEKVVNGVKGQEFTVKTISGRPIHIFAPHPMATQTKEVQDLVNAGKLDFLYNCHGLSLSLQNVVLNGGKPGETGSFSLLDPLDAFMLINSQYKGVTPEEAKQALAAGKKVVAVFNDENNAPVHSAVMTSIVITDGGLDFAKSKCDSKNGWEPLTLGTNPEKLCQRYGVSPVRVFLKVLK